MKKVLFVCYGGGHVRMVLHLAQALRDRQLAEVRILALTTAAPVVRAQGLPLCQFKDFVRPADAAALAQGRALMAGLDHVVDPEETAAYLGLNWADLETLHGVEGARERYAAVGRQAFFPLPTLTRVLQETGPDLVVATSSPRAERAAIEAAGHLGVPAICLVDLFGIAELAWTGQPGFARKVCVLNEAVRAGLLAAGRRPDEVVVTGNPAFDPLRAPELALQGRAMRQAEGWAGRRVVLWAAQPEPLEHPSVPGRRGQPDLPQRIFEALRLWQSQGPDRVLVVRPHPSESPASDPVRSPGMRWDGAKFDLHPLLHAVDAVVTINSTVGLEGHLVGRPVIQMLGSLFDDAVPFARYGIATACAEPAQLPQALDTLVGARSVPVDKVQGSAINAVLDVMKEFLE
ncbi:MAG: hypothetical protein ACOYBQ_09750 [Fluviibacter sp.]